MRHEKTSKLHEFKIIITYKNSQILSKLSKKATALLVSA